jgi:hypothetical protein
MAFCCREIAMCRLNLLLILFVCAAVPAGAGPFEDGKAADKGDSDVIDKGARR